MQHCDATCSHCARDFWAWLKRRLKSAEREAGRSGAGSFADAAATSIKAREMSHFRAFVAQHPTDWLDRLVNDYKVIANTAGALISLKYDQVNSPMADPLVAECRGLVVHQSGEILAWPYDKFWNLGEKLAAPIDWATARVQDKLDGSLMILYYDHENEDEDHDGWRVASSGNPVAGGSYGSAEHTFADEFWRIFEAEDMELPTGTLEETCYMFELVSPNNRIVCKYEVPELICHGARDLVSGQEIPRDILEKLCSEHCWPIVEEWPIHDLESCLKAVEALNPVEREGFIVVDEAFNRVKIKNPRYVALHHLRGSGSANRRRAIELWQSGEVAELLVHFPEMAPEVQPVLDALEMIALRAWQDCVAWRMAPTRKEFALGVKDAPWAAVTFALYKTYLDDRASFKPARPFEIMRGMSVLPLERMVEAVR